MKSDEVVGVLILTLIAMAIFYVLYDIFKNKNGSIVAYILVFSLIMLNVLILYGDMMPFRRGPQINFVATGISGTQIGVPIPEQGGKETRYVSFERRMVPHHVKIESEGVWTIVTDWLSGSVTVPVTAERSLFEEVPQYDCENPNGAINFYGSLGGQTIRNQHHNLIEVVKRQSRIIAHIQSQTGQLEEQVANLANMKIYDMKIMSQELKLVSDNVKNIKVIASKGGGLSADTIGADSVSNS